MRGKQATAAAGRRDAASTATEIETYQRNITALVQERDKLRSDLRDERQAHSKERRILRAQLNEGLSPEIGARDKVIEQLRDQIGRQKAEAVAAQRVHESMVHLLWSILEDAGMTSTEAIEWVMQRIPNAEGQLEKAAQTFAIGVHLGRKTTLTTEQVKRIQRARGERS